jgi:F-type H+-transporting ATPase subunit b
VINLDWTLWMQMINFLVLLFILNHLLYKPILKILDERKKKVNDAADAVKELERSSEEKLARYHEQIQDAKIQALSKKEEIKAAGMNDGNGLIDQAKEESDKVLLQARDDIKKEAAMAREALRRQSQEMATTIAEKLLGRSL